MRLPVFLTFTPALLLASCQILAGLDGPLAPPPFVEASADAPNERSPEDGPFDTSNADVSDAASLSAYAMAVVADRPVALYRFDELSGASCEDRTGNGNTLSLSGPFVRGRPGVVKGSTTSVGLGDAAQLLLPTKFDFGFDQDFSFELWVKPNRLDMQSAFVDDLNNTGLGLTGSVLYFGPTSPFVGYERWHEGTLFRLAHALTPVTPGPGGVFHVVVVNRAQTATLFVNGSRYDGTKGAPDGGNFTPGTFVFGQFPADYADLAIYDKALDDTRVAAHYGAGRLD